jgi:hypothetical protein
VCIKFSLFFFAMFKVSHALVTPIREYSCLERWRYITKTENSIVTNRYVLQNGTHYKTVHVTKQYCTCYRKVTLQNGTSYKTVRYKPLTVTKRYVAKWYGYKTVHCLWLLPIFGQTLLRNGFKYHSIKKTWGLSFKDVQYSLVHTCREVSTEFMKRFFLPVLYWRWFRRLYG